MIVVDENIILEQRIILEKWKIRFRMIGKEFGRVGMQDEEILPLLHRLRQPAFFTRDAHFASPNLCHAGYCLVFLHVGEEETAVYIRRVLRHKQLNTSAKRMGAVVQASVEGVRIWRLHAHSAFFGWD